MILIEHGNQQAVVNNGELTSYRVNGYEYMHQAGNPGWGHSDIEMFPSYLRKKGYYTTNKSKEDYNFIKPEQPIQYEQADNGNIILNPSIAIYKNIAVIGTPGKAA